MQWNKKTTFKSNLKLPKLKTKSMIIPSIIEKFNLNRWSFNKLNIKNINFKNDVLSKRNIQSVKQAFFSRGPLKQTLKQWLSSLSAKAVIFIILTCFIPVATVGWYFITQTVDSLTQAAIDRNNKVADRIASDIGSYVVSKKNILVASAGQSQQLFNPESARNYLRTIQLYYGGNEPLFVADVRGQQIFRTDAQPLANIGDRSYFQTAVKGTAGISDPIRSKANGQITVIAAVPIYDSSNKAQGILGATISLQNLTNAVEQVLSQNPGYGVTIINKDQIPVYYQGNQSLVEEQKQLTEDFYKEAIDKQTGNTLGVARGQEYFISYRPIANTEWVAVTTFPKEVALEAANSMVEKGVWVSVITIGFFVILGLFCTKKALSPLNDLVAGVGYVSKGDLTQRLSCTRQDEFGKVSTAFNAMLENLQQIVHSVKDSAALVLESSSSVATACSQSQTSSDLVASSIVSIAAKLTEQGKSTASTEQALQELVAITEDVSESIEKTAQSTDQCAEIAQEGQLVINKSVDKMQNIKELVKRTAQTVEALGNSMREITQISDTINGIASQTNLLALNAAIEAARAGEAGRGFAVVADEVRKLADQSRNATRHIVEINQRVMSETQGIVQAMNQSYQQVEEGAEIAQTSGAAFQTIVGAVAGIQQQASNIAGKSHQQVQLCQAALKAVADINDFSQHNSNSAQEVATVSEEQAAAISDINHSIEKLAGMANELETMVAQFKV